VRKISFIFLFSLLFHCQQDFIEVRTIKKVPPSSTQQFVLQAKEEEKKTSEKEDKLCSPPCTGSTECKNGRCVGTAETEKTASILKDGHTYVPVSTFYKNLNSIDPLAPN
jgi:hypothetical protein